MRQKRYAQRPINISLRIDDGIPKCPFCHRPFDASVPIIGGNGVSTAFVHDRGEGFEFHHELGVLTHDEDEVDYDESCIYEIGGSECDVS